MSREVVIDTESDGPCPGLYSMICFGCVDVATLETFYGQLRPITSNYLPEVLAISGFTREQHETFSDPLVTMKAFYNWVGSGRVVMISDNPAWDYQWMNYYCHHYLGTNPLGHSARRIGDFAAGLKNNWGDHSSWKRLRETPHTHNPVDDAMGNVEALRKLRGFY